MAKFEIVIDNLAVFVGEQNARPESLLPISFTIDGKTLDNATGDVVRKALQDGLSVRSQITPKDSTLMLEKLLDEGKDVLLLSVSSGICESFATAKYIAKGLGVSGNMPADRNKNGAITLTELFEYIKYDTDYEQDSEYPCHVQRYPVGSEYQLFK